MAYNLEFFSKCLSTMRASMQQQHSNSHQDAIAYAHDRVLYPTPTHNPNGILRWEGSDAETLLRADVEAGVHNAMTPKQMYLHQNKCICRDQHIKCSLSGNLLGISIKKFDVASLCRVILAEDNN